MSYTDPYIERINIWDPDSNTWISKRIGIEQIKMLPATKLFAVRIAANTNAIVARGSTANAMYYYGIVRPLIANGISYFITGLSNGTTSNSYYLNTRTGSTVTAAAASVLMQTTNSSGEALGRRLQVQNKNSGACQDWGGLATAGTSVIHTDYYG